MGRPVEAIKADLDKIKKKLTSIENEIRQLQHKKKTESTLGRKKDAESIEDKIKDLNITKRDLEKLQEKTEKELKAAGKK
jgi:prefoldin subunit 5